MPYLFLFCSLCIFWWAIFRVNMRPTLTIFTAIIMRMRYELASTCLTYRDIHTYIHKYSDFLVVLISVGLARARSGSPQLILSCLVVCSYVFPGGEDHRPPASHICRCEGSARQLHVGRQGWSQLPHCFNQPAHSTVYVNLPLSPPSPSLSLPLHTTFWFICALERKTSVYRCTMHAGDTRLVISLFCALCVSVWGWCRC